MTSPCYECRDRTAMCHATCKRTAAYDALHRKQCEKRLLDMACNEITFAGIRRTESHRNLKI